AEDAVQDAFAVALRKWTGDGLPPNPGGWITTTARNRAIDRLRRESRGRELLSEAALLSPGNDDPGSLGKEGPVQADRLRLVYNTGLTSTTDPDLCSEAIRLARILATLMPDEPEVAGLLALLLLTESRRASRTRPDGSLVLLGGQDRRRWDRALIEEGQAIVRQCLRRN